MITKTTMRKIPAAKDGLKAIKYGRPQSPKARAMGKLNWAHRRLAGTYGLDREVREARSAVLGAFKESPGGITTYQKEKLDSLVHCVGEAERYIKYALEHLVEFREDRKLPGGSDL